MERWDVHVHDLDGPRLPRSLRGLHRMEREHHQLGTSLVRYRCASTPLSQFSPLTSFLQLFAFKSLSPSRGPLAFFVSSVASTTLLPPLLSQPLGPTCVADSYTLSQTLTLNLFDRNAVR